MNKEQFLNMKISKDDTVTVNAIELQSIIRQNNLLTNEVSELRLVNSTISESNHKLVQRVTDLEKDIKSNSNTYSKLVALEANYNKLEKSYDTLVDKLNLSNAISEGRKQRLHCEELTKGLHVDLKS